MRLQFWKVSIFFILVLAHVSLQAKKQKSLVVTDIVELKDYKKLLKTKTNVLILFVNRPKAAQAVSDVVRDAAEAMKGQATLAIIDCSNGEPKKLCKRLKIDPDQPYIIKHYKDGKFNKDYDRSDTFNSITNFLRDPTGELPWEEDPAAADVHHLLDGDALVKFLKKNAAGDKKVLVMFYVPWCGYCKSLKPEYVAAAQELKDEAVLAAIDVAKPNNQKIRQTYNITGFPTLLYFGETNMPYNGEYKKQDLVDFMRDPVVFQKKYEKMNEGWSQDSDVVHLTGENFDSVLSKAEHALVVFYAPWCGHCKKIKPEFEKAAERVKTEKLNGILGAVDATRHQELASRFSVRGYPTLKYFHRGQYKYDASFARQEDQIVEFIKNPQESSSSEDKPWSEEKSAVRHLDTSNFEDVLRNVQHAIVMFYAPWCGHCKTTKPEFTKAANKFAYEASVAFGAVDCTAQQTLCAEHDVKGYPTIKYFSYFDKEIKDYTSGRKEADFVSFIQSQMGLPASAKAKTPDEGFGNNVQLASDSDFETIIKQTTPTFVMFFTTFCSHCSTAKPIFGRLATTLKTDKNYTVRAIAVDAVENPKVSEFASIELLPTFKMYAGGKQLAVYEGEHSYEGMLAFCQSFEEKVKTADGVLGPIMNIVAAIENAISATYSHIVEHYIVDTKL